MFRGVVWLVAAYGLSQFYRAALAVMGPSLNQDIGLSPDQISDALGVWFLAFAAMQIPVGWLLDNRSAKSMCTALLMAGGGGGALVFSLAQGPVAINWSMALIGIGCSPVLMTSLYIFARKADTGQFGMLTGLVLGLGSLGNVLAATPLVYAMEAAGWRWTMVALSLVTVIVALGIYARVEDPSPVVHDNTQPRAGMKDLLKIKALLPVLCIAFVAYAPGAGLRGSWIGSYFSTVYALDASVIGWITLIMAVAMIVGNFLFGAADKWVRDPKLIVMVTTLCALIALLILAIKPDGSHVALPIFLFAAIGFFSSNYPQIMNHGRAMVPPNLVGRGVTLINLFSIGGVGLIQFATSKVFLGQHGADVDTAAPFGAVFLFLAGTLMVGLSAYAFFAKKP